MEDCTPENGALSFFPGSHKTHPVDRRFVRLPSGGTGFETLPVDVKLPPTRDTDYVMKPCPAGTACRHSWFGGSCWISRRLRDSNRYPRPNSWRCPTQVRTQQQREDTICVHVPYDRITAYRLIRREELAAANERDAVLQAFCFAGRSCMTHMSSLRGNDWHMSFVFCISKVMIENQSARTLGIGL